MYLAKEKKGGFYKIFLSAWGPENNSGMLYNKFMIHSTSLIFFSPVTSLVLLNLILSSFLIVGILCE